MISHEHPRAVAGDVDAARVPSHQDAGERRRGVRGLAPRVVGRPPDVDLTLVRVQRPDTAILLAGHRETQRAQAGSRTGPQKTDAGNAGEIRGVEDVDLVLALRAAGRIGVEYAYVDAIPFRRDRYVGGRASHFEHVQQAVGACVNHVNARGVRAVQDEQTITDAIVSEAVGLVDRHGVRPLGPAAMW